MVLVPLDRLEELLLFTDPLLRLLELDLLLFTEPLLLLFDRVRFTVPDDRLVLVLDRLTVDLLPDLVVALERIEPDDLVRLTVLLVRVT